MSDENNELIVENINQILKSSNVVLWWKLLTVSTLQFIEGFPKQPLDYKPVAKVFNYT